MNATIISDLLERLGPGLTLLARQYTLHAEDAVQDAFVRLASQRSLPPHPEAWLFRVVKHRALDLQKMELRRKRREVEHQPQPWFVDDSMDGLERDDAVAALQHIPTDEREIIITRLWGNVSLAEIAEAFGCSIATIHRRYEAGIARLRELLGETKWNH